MDITYLYFVLGIIFIVGVVVTICCIYFYKKELELTEIKKSLEKNDFERVIKLGKEYLKKNPSTFNIYYYLAKAYEGLKHYNEAVEYYEKSLVELQKYPRSALKAEILEKLGDLYLKIEEKNIAIGYFKTILEEFPNNLNSLWQLGKIYFKENDFLKAKSYLEKFVSIKPLYPEAYLLLAKSYYNLENYQKSVNYLNLWFEKEGNQQKSPEEYNRSLIFLSDIYIALKRYTEAVSLLKPLLEDTEALSDALIRLIQIYIKIGDFSKAIKIGDDFLLRIPIERKADVLYELANAYAGCNEIYKAIELWQSVKQIQPKYRDIDNILSRYALLIENKFLSNYFTTDESAFLSFILRKFNTKEFNVSHKNQTFWVIKDEGGCQVLYREAIPLMPAKLSEIENFLIDEGLSTFSVTLFALFGVDKNCYSTNFYKKINVVSGEAFTIFFKD